MAAIFYAQNTFYSYYGFISNEADQLVEEGCLIWFHVEVQFESIERLGDWKLDDSITQQDGSQSLTL
jgi:hypothetical protein